MSSRLNSAEPVRRWLLANGAHRATSEDLHLHKVRFKDESWILNVSWRDVTQIVIALPALFPDVLPQVFIPFQYRKKKLIPHVTPDDGYVCFSPPNSTINPADSVALLLESLRLSQIVVEKQYTSEQFSEEILKELKPYWKFEPDFHLLSIHSNFPNVFSLNFDKERGFWTPQSLTRDQPNTFNNIAFTLSCPPSEVELLLTNTNEWLCKSEALKTCISEFLSAMGNKQIPVKSFDLAFLICVSSPKGNVILPVFLENSISRKLIDGKNFVQSLLSKINQDPLQKGILEDISTTRLMRRSVGHGCINLGVKKVVLVGCGSLGGFIAENLARGGLRNFLLFDPKDFRIANIPRHCSDLREFGLSKVHAVKRRIKGILPDSQVEPLKDDFRTEDSMAKILAFAPDLIIFAIGDTTAELSADALRRSGFLGDCCHTWVEPNLNASHLLFNPAGDSQGFSNLLEPETLFYVHREIKDSDAMEMQESGCQSSYAPYSGLDLVIAAGLIAREILKWLITPPKQQMVLKCVQDQLKFHQIENDRDDLCRSGEIHISSTNIDEPSKQVAEILAK